LRYFVGLVYFVSHSHRVLGLAYGFVRYTHSSYSSCATLRACV